MANWRTHSKPFVGLRRRYRLNRDPTTILDGILPVVQVDKHYTDDTLDLFGMFVQEVHSGVTPRYASCVLWAQEKEVLVHEVTMTLDGSSITRHLGWSYHMMTLHPNYDPVGAFVYGGWYPFLTTKQRWDTDIPFSAAGGISGEAAALQTISIGGGPPITCFGKTLHAPQFIGAPGPVDNIAERHPMKFWSFQDPPIRLKPYTRLMVQTTVDQASLYVVAGLLMNVNFIFSEREDQGDVG